MSKIELSKETRVLLARKLAKHLKSENDVDLGGFEAEFLLDYIAETLGPYFYNQGLEDAQAIFREKMEAVSDALYVIEKPITP